MKEKFYDKHQKKNQEMFQKQLKLFKMTASIAVNNPKG